jgi:hypothetical protein
MSANAELMKMLKAGQTRQDAAFKTVIWQQALLGLFQGVVQSAAQSSDAQLAALASRAIELGNQINDLETAGALSTETTNKILEQMQAHRLSKNNS